MPTIQMNHEVFEKLVGKKLPLETLKDRISMLGTDLEKIEDNVIDVEVFPNRPDMLSEQGFARALSSFIGVKTGLRKFPIKKSGEKVIIEKSVSKVRPYTACAIVKNLKFNNEKIIEVIQLQEKLHITYGRKRKKVAIGIYPFEKITPPIRFKALKPEDIKFRPLEFPKEINGRQILSQHPTGRDYGHLLEGMDMYPIFVDSKDNILSMPPIINSHEVGKISDETKDVFIECSGFDFKVLHICLNIIVTALHDMGGEIQSMELVYPDKTIVTPNLDPWNMPFKLDYINKWLGLDLDEKKVKVLLEKMGYGYEKGHALVPAYRADVLHPLDLAEDIAISYGYENFDAIIPNVATIGQQSKIEVLKDRITESLVGLGLIETSTYNLTSKTQQNENMLTHIPLIELQNSISTDFDVLRNWVTPSMIEVLANNKHHEYPQEVFGFGTVFKKDTKQETGILENERVGVAITSEDVDFTRVLQVFDSMMRSLGVEYKVEETEHDSFIPGRVGRVIVKGKKIAYIGEIHPEVIRNWKLDYPIGVFELNVTELLEFI